MHHRHLIGFAIVLILQNAALSFHANASEGEPVGPSGCETNLEPKSETRISVVNELNSGGADWLGWRTIGDRTLLAVLNGNSVNVFEPIVSSKPIFETAVKEDETFAGGVWSAVEEVELTQLLRMGNVARVRIMPVGSVIPDLSAAHRTRQGRNLVVVSGNEFIQVFDVDSPDNAPIYTYVVRGIAKPQWVIDESGESALVFQNAGILTVLFPLSNRPVIKRDVYPDSEFQTLRTANGELLIAFVSGGALAQDSHLHIARLSELDVSLFTLAFEDGEKTVKNFSSLALSQSRHLLAVDTAAKIYILELDQ